MANQGQLWSGKTQIGKETTAGTGVAATRVFYPRELSLMRDREFRTHRSQTGTRDNLRQVTLGPITAGGSLSQAMSADESLELFLITLQGGVTPSTPSGATLARLWEFKPSTSLDSATIEWDDGARVWEGYGMRGNTLSIEGEVMGENVISVELFGTDVAENGSLTGALSERVPTFLEGWQTNLYCDTFGAAFGQTWIPSALRNWTINFNGNLSRFYTAGNTLQAARIPTGELDITASLTVDAAGAFGVAEYSNWSAQTKRGVRLEFVGPAAEIEAGANEAQTITIDATGGTFTITFMGATTGALAWNASANTVRDALVALPTIGSDNGLPNVTVGLASLVYTITFVNHWAEYNVPALTTNAASLTGGAQTAAVATTVPGRSGRKYVIFDMPGAWNAIALGESQDGIRTYTLNFTAMYDPTLAAMMRVLVQNNRTAAFA